MAGYPALLLMLTLAQWSNVAVNGFPFGAPGPPFAACTTLSPNPTFHGAPPQTSPVPYEVDLTSLLDSTGGFSYEPGVTYARMSM